VLSLLVCAGCGRHRSFASAPLGTPEIEFEEAVYFLPHAPAKASAIVDGLLRKQPSDLSVTARMERDLTGEYSPLDPEQLKYYGRRLSAAQVDALQGSKDALLLHFRHPRSAMWRGLRNSAEVTEIIARSTGGLIFDRETREVFSVDEWHRRRLSEWFNDEPPSIADHTTIHLYDDGEFVRAVTLGMKKFGLPDIVMTGFVWSVQNQIGNVINLVCQAMAEGTPVGMNGAFELDVHKIKSTPMRAPVISSLEGNGTGVAHLTLIDGKRDEGDPDNRLVEISSDKYKGNDSHARLEAMLTGLLGATDQAKTIDHSEALLAASRKAREHLPELRTDFNAKLQPGESILLKAPFTTDDGHTEWMWVEVTQWDGNAIRGLLMNDPDRVRNLHAGQLVDVDEWRVFDYIRIHPDGTREGNTTAAIIEKQSR